VNSTCPASSKFKPLRPFEGNIERGFSSKAGPLKRPFPYHHAALLAVSLTGIGYGYSYCIDNKVSKEDLLRKFENFNDWSHEKFQELLDRHFPHTDEPLLPELKDFNCPENWPTLVVDLDKVIVKMEHDRTRGWRVVKRPGADRFFKELAYLYQIVVWSDDAFPVAQDVCSRWGIPIVGALHRDQCHKRAGGWVKDLNRLGRRLERTVIIDHDPRAFSLQPENAILIREFDGDESDRDLESLIDFLTMVATSPDDVRKTIKKFGGGDENLGKRWMVFKSEQEKKAESRRSFGRAFGGNLSYSPISGKS